jgi:hypothetical protein
MWVLEEQFQLILEAVLVMVVGMVTETKYN